MKLSPSRFFLYALCFVCFKIFVFIIFLILSFLIMALLGLLAFSEMCLPIQVLILFSEMLVETVRPKPFILNPSLVDH